MSIYVQPLAFMEGLGGSEVFLVVVVIFVLFGGEKLPEFARGAGKLIREFKKASSGVEEEFKRALEEEDRKKSIATLESTPYVPPTTPTLPALEEPAPTPEGDATNSAPAAAPLPLDLPPPASASDTPPAPSLKPPSPPKMLPGEDDDLLS